MRNTKRTIKKIAIGFFALALFLSCDDDRGYDDYDAGGTPTAALNGEWWIDLSDEATGDVLVQHILHKTADSGMNDGRMYIDDAEGGYFIKGLVETDPGTLTFSTTDEENLLDPGTTFTITEGRIMKNAAHSRNGTVVDSIYFKGHFSYDDPGTTVIFAGHRRTGFLEDEY
jgi:hypothetical protein